MADTFSNDLRLRLQESGSNASTWGTLLNGTITNIASALGQGSEAIPNASTHTITLADGTADEARSLYLKCTGGGQACTVTLGPNTISKVWIIDNETSFTLTFSQGSGANVAIAAGAVKVIATDGAGSGAAVVDTLDGLEGSFSTLAVTGAVTANGLTVQTATNEEDGLLIKQSDGTPVGSLRINNGSFLLKGKNASQPVQIQSHDGNEDIEIDPDGFIKFETAGSETMRITGSNVGIGTNSPNTPIGNKSLHIKGTSGSELVLERNDTGVQADDFIGGLAFLNSDASNTPPHYSGITARASNEFGAGRLEFFSSFEQYPSGTPDMTLDGGGTLLVGKTSQSTNTIGVEARADGTFADVKSNGGAAVFGRNTNGGTIVGFRKDGANVGAIGSTTASSGDLLIFSTSSGHVGLQFGNTRIHPTNNAGAVTDNSCDLGFSNTRFKIVYAAGGLTQTSDRNEKQDIAELTDAEQRVAVVAKGLLRKYRWKDSVEAKGDNARIHFGIIAQDLQDAFTAEGLDAARYGMWCSDTWWETQTEVAAVEATEDIEAVDAYTRTDNYDTAEEAPEGATERTRLGVRYSELLAFIISAI
jgi:hypothetical protein